MAEGLLRHLAGDRFVSLSAGSKSSGYVHQLAVEAMDEIGISLKDHKSESIDEYLAEDVVPDLVISVCGNAATNCPVFPGKVARLHRPFEDPAHVTGTVEDRKEVFKTVRNQIQEALENWLAEGAKF